MLRTTAIFGVCVLLGLSACGGGGSSSAPQSQQSSVVSSVNMVSSASAASVVNSSSSFSSSTAISSLSASSISSASGSFISSSLTSLASSSASSTATSAVAKPQTIGGKLSGLTRTGLVLTNNGVDDLPLSANGSFTFSQSLLRDSNYSVAVKTQPEGQLCSVTNGSGTVLAAVTNIVVTCVTPRMEVFAGEIGEFGYVDATTASAAFFASPKAVAIDTTGNVYVADRFNHAIRKITPAGVVTTLAGGDGSGFSDGTGKAAKFSSPSGLVVDKNGNLFVADSSNHAIRKITSAGVVTTVAGSGIAGLTNATGAAAAFNQPKGIALDSSGNLYVADFANHVIRKITPTGVVTTFAGSGVRGALNGTGTAAQFNAPTAIALDASGNLYVADTSNHAIRKITPAGLVASFAGSTTGSGGIVNGTASLASFNSPEGITVDATGNLYVADTGNHVIRKITQAAQVTTFAGGFTDIRGDINGFVNATNSRLAQFDHPAGVAVDATGNLFVADTFNSVIRKVTPAGVVSTYAGSGEQGFTDGTGAAAKFRRPAGMVGDASGNLYLADSGNHAIRKITPSGVVTILSGKGTSGFVDGTGAAASFNNPLGVVIDSKGNLFVTDFSNNAIRKVTTDAVVSTFAGGTRGFTDGTGATAQFERPVRVAIDALDTMYVVDQSGRVIRKVTPAGVVTTLAGSTTAGFLDGVGTSAQFASLQDIVSDRAGNLFVSDGDAIRKVTPSGLVTTFAGGIKGFADGSGAGAKFNQPATMAIDGQDNIYVFDLSNNCIRKITPAGFVSTVIGQQGKFGFVAGELPGIIGTIDGGAVMTIVGNTLYIRRGNGIVKVSNLP